MSGWAGSVLDAQLPGGSTVGNCAVGTYVGAAEQPEKPPNRKLFSQPRPSLFSSLILSRNMCKQHASMQVFLLFKRTKFDVHHCVEAIKYRGGA